MTQRLTTGTVQIDPRFILWRKIRFPLAAGIALIILIITFFAARSCLIDRGIRSDLERATELAAEDTFQSHQQALELLEGLSNDHPDHDGIATRYAWQLVLMTLRHGLVEERTPVLQKSFERISRADIEPTPLLKAVQGGFELVQNKATAAVEKIGESHECSEERFVLGLAHSRQGNTDKALAMLDLARQDTPPFVPALGELALILRQQGRFDEANAALGVVLQTAPGHEGATIQTVLLALDRANGNKIKGSLPELAQKLGKIPNGAKHPRFAAYKEYASGRIALLQGKTSDATASLSKAAAALKKNQRIASWLARSRRKAGQHEEALKALTAFPNKATTDPVLLKTRAEILLDLYRSEDAEDPIAVLSRQKGVDVSFLEGRRLFYQGFPDKALPLLRQAVRNGHKEASLLLAESFLHLGKAGGAQSILKAAIKGSGPVALCASGYERYIKGRTEVAIENLAKASAAGGQCGIGLSGRLLVSSGGTDSQRPYVSKGLPQREDLRDRVALARILFRIEGVKTARAELDRVKGHQPQSALLLRELALAYEEFGLIKAAREVALEATKTTNGHPFVVSVAARHHRERRYYKQAGHLLRRAQRQYANSPYLHLEKAAFLADRNRFADAEEASFAALIPGPLFGQAACLSANIQLRRGSREDAQASLVRATTTAKRQVGAYSEAEIRTCLVTFHLKRGPSALPRAKTALFFLKHMPFEWVEIAFNGGQISEREARMSEAESRYREALKLDPSHRPSWKRLGILGTLTAEERQFFQKLYPGKNP